LDLKGPLKSRLDFKGPIESPLQSLDKPPPSRSSHQRLANPMSHTSNAPHRAISDVLRAELEEHNALDMALWRASSKRFQHACMV
jgi:hypothetical protein